MSKSVFLAGILQFENRARFEEALEAIRSEEDYSSESSMEAVFAGAMVSEGLMVLRHHAQVAPALYEKMMGEAYLLSEFAGRGYLVAAQRGPKPQVNVAMAAMRYPASEAYASAPDPDPATDYLPRIPRQVLRFRYQSEGNVTEVAWRVHETTYGRYRYLSFPHLDSPNHFNDWWDGQYFLKAGHKLYTLVSEGDETTLRDPAEEEIQLILDGLSKPGSMQMSYLPGTENFRLYTHEGYEDIETPAGNFDRCMKIRVDLYFLPTDEDRYAGDEGDRVFTKVTTTHYFGKGVGLVRLLFQEGTLDLIAVELAPETSEPPTPETTIAGAQTTPSPDRPKARKPWWKLW